MESNLILQHNILYSRGHHKVQSSEHYFPDHALGIMLSGESYYFSNEGTFIMKEGTICIMRRNQLFKKLKKPGPTGEPPTLISVFLDQNALHRDIFFLSVNFDPAMEEFIAFVKTIIGIDDLDLQLVLSRCTERQVPKGKLILRKGQIANQYFFIVAGGVRFFYDRNDQENTTWVTFKNEFFTEISSLNPQKPSRFNIEAIEDTRLVVIAKKDMDFLYGHVTVWEEFGRKIWEAMAVRMIDQILNFQTLSAEQRYLEFMNNPEFLQKVPIKQLAAVLGITPNALSRIRKNIR